MGRGINRAMLIGTVSDYKASAKKPGFQRFILTTTEHYTNSAGERIASESWVRVTTPAGSVVVAENQTVLIIGRVANRTFQKDGMEVLITEIDASDRVAIVDDTTEHLNEIHWAGRLGGNPEMRYMSSGVEITNLRSVTGDTFTDRSGTEVDTTCWVQLTAWRKLAKLLNERLSKGDLLVATGRIGSRTYTDRDGNSREASDITILDVEFPPKAAKAAAVAAPGLDEDEVDF